MRHLRRVNTTLVGRAQTMPAPASRGGGAGRNETKMRCVGRLRFGVSPATSAGYWGDFIPSSTVSREAVRHCAYLAPRRISPISPPGRVFGAPPVMSPNVSPTGVKRQIRHRPDFSPSRPHAFSISRGAKGHPDVISRCRPLNGGCTWVRRNEILAMGEGGRVLGGDEVLQIGGAGTGGPWWCVWANSTNSGRG